MATEPLEETGERMAQTQLERAYLAEYLRGQGHTLETIKALPADQAHELMRAASLFASMRMAEVETRSHLVEEMHGGPVPM